MTTVLVVAGLFAVLCAMTAVTRESWLARAETFTSVGETCVEVMRTAQFAGILVFDVGRLLERIGGTAHATPRRRGFSSRNGHFNIL